MDQDYHGIASGFTVVNGAIFFETLLHSIKEQLGMVPRHT